MFFAKAFAILYLDGFDLTLPKDNTGRVRFTDHVSGSGERLFEQLEALNLEGMMMKRKASVYSFSRCRDWLKVRTSGGRVTMQKRIENWG